MRRVDLGQRGRAFVVPGLLSPVECEGWIQRAEALGYEPAPINTRHGTLRMPGVRNNERAMADRPDWAAELWRQVQPLFAGDDLAPIGLNHRLRFYRYGAGQWFRPHTDGAYHRPGTTERSLFTMLIYLNEGFEGGETILHELPHAVVPATGLGLFFVHRQVHEGAAILSGEKLVLRSDVMFDLA
jgi:predicted 2-oxoglutarate/Fe(II)-dependent dioxygenase YbiX